MTWEDFYNKYSNLDYDSDCFHYGIGNRKQLIFFDDGIVWLRQEYNGSEIRVTLATGISVDKMEQILLALSNEVTNDLYN